MTESRTLYRASRAVWRSVVGLVHLVAVAGCILVAPPSTSELRNKEMTHAPAPEQWTAQGAAAGQVESNWLATFADVQLESLVAEAMQYNGDLRATAARVEQAAAYVRVAGGELYPALNALGRAGGEMS